MPDKRLFLLICVLVIIVGTNGSLEQNNSSFQNLGVNVSQPAGDLTLTPVVISGILINSTEDLNSSTPGADEGNQSFLGGSGQEIQVGGGVNESIHAQEFVQSRDEQRSPDILTQQDSVRISTSSSRDSNLKQKGGKEKTSYAEDELIIRFKSEPGKKTDHEIADKAHKNASERAKKNSKVKEDFSVKKDFNEKGLSGTQVVKIPKGMTVDEAIALYAENPDVLSVEPNFRLELMEIPDDPDFLLQWGLLNTANSGADINAVPAWNITTGNHRVIIAIPDTGIDIAHPDLAENIWSNPGEVAGNGIDDDGNGYIDDVSGWDFVNSDADPSDDNGHGTHVAGIAGAVGNNNRGITGVMWETELLSLKVIGSDGYGYDSDAIEAILYAQNAGAQIISISWGSSGESQALAEAIAHYPGIVVCAAGNSASDNDVTPLYPASYSSDNILSVTATDAQGNLASFANYGASSVDIAAPGVNIYSTISGSGYGYRSGTSMAAPYIAGVAGLVLSEEENLGGAELADIITKSSEPLISLQGRISSSGRVDAENALILARAGYRTTPTPTLTPTLTLTPTPTSIIPEGEPQVAPLNPEFLYYLQMKNTTILAEGDDDFHLGFVPSPIDRSSMQGQVLAFSEQEILALPSSYSLLPNNVTSVKDQGQCGSCWAFATYGSAESVLKPEEVWDFSEDNLKNLHGFDNGPCAGGNYDMSAAYLARWSGPITEAADPYSDSSTSYSPTGLPPAKHVQNVLYIPGRTNELDNNNIKNALMTYGGVSTAFYWASSSYNYANNAYYSSGYTGDNHGVTIVGWDDTFSKSKFLTQPAGDGAFLIKNSWGTDFGNAGYFWISYYDTRLGKSSNAVFLSEPPDNYDFIYQYDPLGRVLSYGYGSNTAWGANVFTSTRSERLNAVGFYAASPNTAYEIRIYKNPTGGPISSGGAVSYRSGTITIPGYRTIPLNTPVSLNAGEKFSIVVKLTTPGYIYPIPIEYPYSGYSTAATATAGQSYVSYTGSSWTDLTSEYANTNVCVKGYTEKAFNAQIVSSQVPTAMNVGYSQTASVTVKNTGAFPWTSANGIKLGTVGDASGDAYKFLKTTRVTLPSGVTVAPGETYTFTFTMTAPTTAGTYTPQFRMVQEGIQWFGETKSYSVQVTPPNAQITTNTVPTAITMGYSQTASVTVKNTGAFPWTSANGIKLGTVGDASGDAYKFLKTTRVTLPSGATVAPGESYTFTFTMTAPTTAGAYTPKFQMVQEGVQWFGETLSISVQVIPPTNNAQVATSTVPTAMNVGYSQTASVTVKNTGAFPWTSANGIKLGTVGDASGDAYKFLKTTRVTLPSGVTVAPGETYTFTFTMTAPTTAGTYTPQFRMVQEGVQWFGETKSYSVQVTPPNAQITTNTVPTAMTTGYSQTASVTVKNTGAFPWTSANGIKLGTVGDASGDAYKFLKTTRVTLPSGVTVAPGESYTFTFTMTAPTTAGAYTPKFRMVQEGVQWFGETKSYSIQVTPPNAQITTNTVPTAMTTGYSQTASVTVKNTGAFPWTSANGIKLGTVGDASGDAYKFLKTTRVTLPSGATVAPGESYTFTFTMTAPTTAGAYTPKFRMVQEGVQWFGDPLSRTVQVTAIQ